MSMVAYGQQLWVNLGITGSSMYTDVWSLVESVLTYDCQ